MLSFYAPLWYTVRVVHDYSAISLMPFQDKVYCVGILANNEMSNSHDDPGDQINLAATAKYARPVN